MTRTRSVWGWGWEENFPPAQDRAALAAQVGGLLGIEGLSLEEPTPQSQWRVRPSRLPELPPALAGLCRWDTLTRAHHTWGRSYPDMVRGFGGDFSAAPDVVASPRTEADIQGLLSWAAQEGVAVVPRGGGTSVVGGVQAPEGARATVCLSLSELDRVLEIDPTSRAALIEAGATGPRLEEQLRPGGWTLRHFPQSFEFSTLGGWIATRAGGHFATLYTHIDDLVESIRMITPRGPWESRRLPASGAGPSPDRLVLGSEGILGVITRAWVRIQPRPGARLRASLHFEDWDAAVAACRALSQSGLYPTNCRLLDPTEALLHRVCADGSTVLLLAFESERSPRDAWMDEALAIAWAHGGQCPRGVQRLVEGEGQGERDAAASWKEAFTSAPYLQNSLISIGVLADTFETACTWEAFPRLHAAVRARVGGALERVCGGGRVSCRFTHVYPDGPAPYYTFLGPARRGQELTQWAAVKEAAGEALAEAGATITHHHAVGRVHRPWYQREVPPLFQDALRAAKASLDPTGILNPGVLIDP